MRSLLVLGLLLTLPLAARAEELVVVAFGDSITLGPGLPPEATYPAQLQVLLRQELGREDVRVINAGVGGSTVLAGLARLDEAVLAHRPRYVLVGFGMNDSVMVAAGQVRVSRERFAAGLRDVVARVQATGAQALLATVTPVIEEYYFERHPRAWYPKGLDALLECYSATVREVAHETDCPVVDLSTRLPRAGLRTPENSNSRDGVHPTPEGCGAIARAYAEALLKLLRPAPAEGG